MADYYRSGTRLGWDINAETWQEYVDALEEARNTKTEECHHCQTATEDLTNYSRTYGGYVGPHWLCRFCSSTKSASMLGAGGTADRITQDTAAMLNELADNRGTLGIWFVFGYDVGRYPISIHNNEMDALRSALNNHGYAIFWPFDTDFDTIKG